MSGGQNGIRLVICGSLHEIGTVHLIGSPDVTRTLDCLPVSFSGSGIRREQIIPSVSLENMRSFQEDLVRAVNIPHRSCHLLLYRVVFLQHQTSCILFRYTVVCHHAYHIFSAVIIMKHRGVKSEIIQRYRV